MRNRRSIRQSNYDYSKNGCYFVTICSYEKECIFGEIRNTKMVLNESEKVLEDVWKLMPKHHSVKLDAFQVMPNHIHGILKICRGVARNTRTNRQNIDTDVTNCRGVACYTPTTKREVCCKLTEFLGFKF